MRIQVEDHQRDSIPRASRRRRSPDRSGAGWRSAQDLRAIEALEWRSSARGRGSAEPVCKSTPGRGRAVVDPGTTLGLDTELKASLVVVQLGGIE